MTEKDITDICAELERSWPETVSYDVGNDDGRFVNLFVTTSDRAMTWERIRAYLIDSELPGGEMRDAMIVTMTGDQGWDDYLLLHHFDRSEQLDSL